MGSGFADPIFTALPGGHRNGGRLTGDELGLNLLSRCKAQSIAAHGPDLHTLRRGTDHSQFDQRAKLAQLMIKR